MCYVKFQQFSYKERGIHFHKLGISAVPCGGSMIIMFVLIISNRPLQVICRWLSSHREPPRSPSLTFSFQTKELWVSKIKKCWYIISIACLRTWKLLIILHNYKQLALRTCVATFLAQSHHQLSYQCSQGWSRFS